MRHSLQYKSSRYRKTIGFIELNTRGYTLNLRIIRSCSRYQPKVKTIHRKILEVLEKDYDLIEGGHNIRKVNMWSNSRISNNRRKQNESRTIKK